jgi:hypothetical protein
LTDLDQRWTRKVTDVRNWFTFAASERWREDDTEHEHYSDSGGKSGGQKEKLAYTILAATELEEFLAGSDPLVTQSILKCSVARSATEGSLDITILRRPDRNYIIESSPSLELGATWTQVDQLSALEDTFSGPMTMITSTTIDNTSIPSVGTSLFYRAREITEVEIVE